MPPAEAAPQQRRVDRLLLVELSANLYGTWGQGWNEALEVTQHLQCLRLWTWTLSRAIEAEVATYIETVRSDLDAEVPSSFRLWIPLVGDTIDRFVTACAGAMPVWTDASDPKRPRIEHPTGSGKHLALKRDVFAALATYVGGTPHTDVSVSPIVDGEVPENHILQLLAASPQFARQHATHAKNAVPAHARQLSSYLAETETGYCLCLPGDRAVVSVAAMKLNAGDELLDYLLPHITPTDADVAANAAAIAHATASDCGTARPDVKASHDNEGHLDEGVLEALLRTVYPVLERVKAANYRRIRAAGLPAVEKRIAAEIDTLFSIDVPGTPAVYAACTAELKSRLKELRAPATNEVVKLAQQMFFRPTAKSMTSASSVLASIISGACGAAMLLPAQRKLFVLLWLRSHKVTANHLGSNGCVVCCGPPETGKSKACQVWLSALPRAIVGVQDVTSAKAYTAPDRKRDLTACYRDEMHELAKKGATDDPNTKAQQTLLSNGIIMVERLVRDPDCVTYRLQKEPKAGRMMSVFGTNSLNEVPPAILSRATIVAVPATKGRCHHSAATLASIGESKANALCDGFLKYCQALAAMQVDYWAADAVGALEIDDRMVLLFRLLAEAENQLNMSARKMVEVRHMAVSIMVLDLGSQWYRYGVGAEHGFDRAAQLAFYAANSVVKMEHVLAAVSVATMSTNIDSELQTVALALRSLIRVTAGGEIERFAGDANYFALNTNRRRLHDDVAARCPALGEGLGKTILNALTRDHTAKKPNIKFVTDDVGHEHALVNAAFVAKFNGVAEHEILQALDGETWTPSWCGQYRVYRAGVRARYTTEEEERGRAVSLSTLAVEEMKMALAMLRARTVVVESKRLPAWSERERCDTAWQAPTSKHADARGNVRKSEIQPLCVHVSLFDGDGGKNSRVHRFFTDCLAIAGGYAKKRVVIGIGPRHRGAATVDVPEHHSVSITTGNPFHKTDNLDELLGPSEFPTDSIFPAAAETLTFTHESNAEAICFADRAPCPTAPTGTAPSSSYSSP
jgi:hypothetical protein